MRSKGSLKPNIPCLDDPVNKLEGLGEKTRKNLLDIRACAAMLQCETAVPDKCPNTVTTGITCKIPSMSKRQVQASRMVFQHHTCASAQALDSMPDICCET